MISSSLVFGHHSFFLSFLLSAAESPLLCFLLFPFFLDCRFLFFFLLQRFLLFPSFYFLLRVSPARTTRLLPLVLRRQFDNRGTNSAALPPCSGKCPSSLRLLLSLFPFLPSPFPICSYVFPFVLLEAKKECTRTHTRTYKDARCPLSFSISSQLHWSPDAGRTRDEAASRPM